MFVVVPLAIREANAHFYMPSKLTKLVIASTSVPRKYCNVECCQNLYHTLSHVAAYFNVDVAALMNLRHLELHNNMFLSSECD